MESLILAVIALVVVDLHPAAGAVQCQDENGQPVDWAILYKMPESVVGSSVSPGEVKRNIRQKGPYF